MNAIIKILTTQNIIITESPINFSPVELPYGAVGFGMNGSSISSEENLNLYWSHVQTILTNNNLTTNDYVSLKSIEYDNIFYGISN